jgi:hypothetical protein
MLITNWIIPSIASAVASDAEMNLYPILMRLRPPRMDLYSRIVLAEEPTKTRLMYSFVIDYIRGGAGNIFARSGLIINMAGYGTFITPLASPITNTIFTITPVELGAKSISEFMDIFTQANPEYCEILEDFNDVKIAYIDAAETMAIAYPIE